MKTLWLTCGVVLLLSPLTQGASRTFAVITNTAAVNHWPSADGFIGTADDVASAGLSTYGRSSPNQPGSYSFIVTSFGLSPKTDPLLFANYDTATFVSGSVTIDPTLFVTNDVPLVTNLELGGTELFPGHGPYHLRMTNRRSGSYVHAGNVFSFSSRYDFEGTFVAGATQATNALATGIVVQIDAADFDVPELTAAPDALAGYVRAVAVPLAKSLKASGLLCGTMNLETAGSIPGTAGYFPPLKAFAVVLAMDFTVALRFDQVQVTKEGVSLSWPVTAGTAYSLESTDSLGVPFTTLASSLTQGQYTDRTALGKVRRFYRLRSP